MIKNAKRIVFKVGTSSLTFENGKPDFNKIEQLARVLSKLHTDGREVILVSSGAMSAGIDRLKMHERPVSTPLRQAIAAVGQCSLISLYDKAFSEYKKTAAQVLITRDIAEQEILYKNAVNTFNTLLDIGAIPVVNENDTVSTAELEGNNFGDNDTLSAIVSVIVSADALVILTDRDGLLDKNPAKYDDAVLISDVYDIDESIYATAGGSGSTRGTGGMKTKLDAAKIATAAGIDTYILNGKDADLIYKLLDGDGVGTRFHGIRNSEFGIRNSERR